MLENPGSEPPEKLVHCDFFTTHCDLFTTHVNNPSFDWGVVIHDVNKTKWLLLVESKSGATLGPRDVNSKIDKVHKELNKENCALLAKTGVDIQNVVLCFNQLQSSVTRKLVRNYCRKEDVKFNVVLANSDQIKARFGPTLAPAYALAKLDAEIETE